MKESTESFDVFRGCVIPPTGSHTFEGRLSNAGAFGQHGISQRLTGLFYVAPHCFPKKNSKHYLVSESQARYLWEGRQLALGQYPPHPSGGLVKIRMTSPYFSFIDLFAGIGGFHRPLHELGGECVFTSEFDKFCRRSYEANYATGRFVGDITKVEADDIPPHDILAAGFPCQPFSLAGVSKYNSLGYEHGFRNKTKGTLFFDVARIIEARRPGAFILENVKNLVSHDRGRTFETIKQVLEKELKYTVRAQIIDAAHFLPQHRKRVFIVGFREDLGFEFPELPVVSRPTLAEVLESDVDEKYTLSDKLWTYLKEYAEKHRRQGNGFGYGLIDPGDPEAITRTLSARYYKDGSEILINQGPKRNPRRLTPRECARLMGFPDDHQIPVSDTQAYKQFGNGVAVPVVRYVVGAVVETLMQRGKIENGGIGDQFPVWPQSLPPEPRDSPETAYVT
jgi:DNA (cytosine-5)-methyltransferase 1